MKKNIFWALSIAIIVISVISRFSRYSDRWGLAYDQAHDAVIARHAVDSRQLPLLGPFSSAGPFQTSGVWYWFIMAGTLMHSSSVISPWVFLTVLYIFFVFGMIYVGTLLVDETLGIIAGLLTCVSTAQIAQAVNLTNQSPLALTSLLSLLCFIFYGKTKKPRYLFLLGFFVSLSASIHLQGTSLVSLIVISILFFGVPSLSSLLWLFIGLFLPIIPILLFDIGHQFINTKNMIQYVFIDQYKISLEVLGRRWQTFLISFLPYEWSHIIGGKSVIGMVLFLGGMVFSPFILYFKHKKIINGIVLSSGLMFVVLRYTRTPLFSSYMVFLHPFILLLSALFIYFLLKRYFVIGAIILVLVLTFSVQKSLEEINYGVNLSDQQARTWRTILTQKFPYDSFSVYDFKQQTIASSITLALYMDAHNKISDSGKKIAISVYPQVTPSGELIFVDKDKGVYLLSDNDDLSQSGWGRVNPEDIYNSTEYWADR